MKKEKEQSKEKVTKKSRKVVPRNRKRLAALCIILLVHYTRKRTPLSTISIIIIYLLPTLTTRPTSTPFLSNDIDSISLSLSFPLASRRERAKRKKKKGKEGEQPKKGEKKKEKVFVCRFFSSPGAYAPVVVVASLV